MVRTPSPAHGFFPVAVAFHCYVFLVVGITLALGWLGLPDGALLVAFFVVAAVLLKQFLPLFRRLVPDGPTDTE